MGISGLLPLLKSIQKPCHVQKFSGQTIGVDGYGWLHRGTTACAVQLALGQQTTKYVEFAMNRVRMLIHFGITPYLVFDGDYLPSKAGTEKERATRREEARKSGLQLMKLGKTTQAHQELQKAIDVTPEMACLFIEELKRAHVKYVVAPYEADSQLAYLERSGHIQAILSEDSDLLVFGARCLLTKLDQYGECVMIRRDDFTACREISLVGWTDQDFRRMAILSGCDYLDSIEGVGLKTAYRLLRRHKSIERVLQAVRLEGKLKVPQDYLASFIQAEMTFLYQWVFCPVKNRLVNLTPPDSGIKIPEMKYLGQYVEPETSRRVATGEINPHTKQQIDITATRFSGRGHVRPTPKAVDTENLFSGKNKSIDTFFKPNRVPLAELDPNSFAMSPHQQNLSRRASSASWSSPLASTPRQNQAIRTSTAPTPLQSSTSRHRLLSDSIQRPKRQRLCHEDSGEQDSVDSPNIVGSRSKYFSQPKKVRKKEQPNFEIFSDEAAEEAMLQLPIESHDQALNQIGESDLSKPQVEQAISQGPDPVEAEKDDSQITLIDDDKPLELSEELDAEDTFVNEDSVKTRLFDKFILKEAIEVSKPPSLASPLPKKRDDTTVDHPSQSSLDPVDCQTRPAAVPKAEKLDISDFTWIAKSSQIVVPGSDDVEPSPPEAKGPTLKGSEDLLVSESEEEAEQSKVTSPTLSFDVRRFAYSSKITS